MTSADQLMSRADSLRDRGKTAQAAIVYRLALELRRNALGPNHPDVAQSMNKLASALFELERFDEAEPLYRQSLGVRKQNFGMFHRDVAATLSNLANLFKNT